MQLLLAGATQGFPIRTVSPGCYSHGVLKELSGFTFTSCAVRTKAILGFCAQKEVVDDPFEANPTALVFYYPEEPPERQWAMSGIGETTGVRLCAALAPEERWAAVTDDGEVYVVGKGDGGWEEGVSPTKRGYFSNVRSIRGGHERAKRLLCGNRELGLSPKNSAACCALACGNFRNHLVAIN